MNKMKFHVLVYYHTYPSMVVVVVVLEYRNKKKLNTKGWRLCTGFREFGGNWMCTIYTEDVRDTCLLVLWQKKPSKSQAENPKLDTMGESKAQKMCMPSLNSCQFFLVWPTLLLNQKLCLCQSDTDKAARGERGGKTSTTLSLLLLLFGFVITPTIQCAKVTHK